MHKRKLYIDVLRIVATLMIMFNHTSTFGFALYTVRTEGILYWIYLFLAILVKTAVPIFFMISGGLLLAKEEPISTLLTKRFLRFAIALTVGSFIHYGYFSKWQFDVMSVSGFVENMFSGGIVIQYWYLYSYLGFLLMLPLLRKLANALDTKGFVYLLILYFLMKCLDVVQFVVWQGNVEHSPYFSFFIMGDNIFYPLVGYFIDYRLPKEFLEKKKSGWISIVVSAGIIGICCVLTRMQSMLLNAWDEGSTQTFFNTFIFIPAGCIYFVAKYWLSKCRVSEKILNILCKIGLCTFGVYLLETIYREETKPVFWIMLSHFPTIIACVTWILCAFILGIAVTFILKNVPIINRVL